MKVTVHESKISEHTPSFHVAFEKNCIIPKYYENFRIQQCHRVSNLWNLKFLIVIQVEALESEVP